eukprot:CAMPEP_0203889988 /NCGR_PEP_ID=MMETSP0359-20131031/33471_1 /ASSEMBLY_ACC=CAM_ASM_000338 /TAXON_ID=268821 /ORGANISM="Scrippsiella Hangoei, Strain SHTV-5" /LENGTH=461 /DNA_ID=CAMNT_0050811521 /DNA_START=38 /DNA_END=1423 /DNA_ORIENTATION=+
MAHASLQTIEHALNAIRYPEKNAVWEHVKRLGKQHARKFPSYAFIPRGGLSSPYVQYVTDVDFILNNPHHGPVAVGDFDQLLDLAEKLCRGPGNVYSARVSWGEEELFDQEVRDMGQVRLHVEKGADVVTLTGIYGLQGGWSVPMDFTLQRGDSRMSKANRISKIYRNIKEHNFAKVVSRIRAILKASKQQFADSWNATGGALRFLVKQLDLVQFMPSQGQRPYLTAFLQLPPHPSAAFWKELASAEMQRRALHLLQSSRALLSSVLGPDASKIFALLDAAPSPSVADVHDALVQGLAGLRIDDRSHRSPGCAGGPSAESAPGGAPGCRAERGSADAVPRAGSGAGHGSSRGEQGRAFNRSQGPALAEGSGVRGQPSGSNPSRGAQQQSTSGTAGTTLAERLPPGTSLNARFSDGLWYDASVVQVRGKAPQVKVHFNGYDKSDDQWVGLDGLRSKRLEGLK